MPGHESNILEDMKMPGGSSPAGPWIQAFCPGWTWESLEHAEHDGADESEGDIRGDNAQSADESHGKTPLVHVVPALTL